MKYSKQIYMFLGVIFILSFLLTTLLPVDKLFKGIASTPAIAALLGALFQLFRDQAEFEKKKSKCSGGWVSKYFRSNPNQVAVL